MGEIINLRIARKAKARSDNETAAAANRAKFGTTKSEKLLTKALKKIDKKHLDAHQLDSGATKKP